MKILLVNAPQLRSAGRWDIDYHLPPVGIGQFPKAILKSVSSCAEVIKKKRDPTLHPDRPFKYVDISSVDVETGLIARPQELTGEEAPSRARKVIHAYDIIISTCRPTRGAIAVVPEELHGQICSTGFSVVRAKSTINPFYLHFALRLESTLEQFRKWSTGSSYPAILDEDVSKTLIPLPDPKIQDEISRALRNAAVEREKAIQAANDAWKTVNSKIMSGLSGGGAVGQVGTDHNVIFSIEQIQFRLKALGPVEEETASADDEILDLFSEQDDDDAD